MWLGGLTPSSNFRHHLNQLLFSRLLPPLPSLSCQHGSSDVTEATPTDYEHHLREMVARPDRAQFDVYLDPFAKVVHSHPNGQTIVTGESLFGFLKARLGISGSWGPPKSGKISGSAHNLYTIAYQLIHPTLATTDFPSLSGLINLSPSSLSRLLLRRLSLRSPP